MRDIRFNNPDTNALIHIFLPDNVGKITRMELVSVGTKNPKTEPKALHYTEGGLV